MSAWIQNTFEEGDTGPSELTAKPLQWLDGKSPGKIRDLLILGGVAWAITTRKILSGQLQNIVKVMISFIIIYGLAILFELFDLSMIPKKLIGFLTLVAGTLAGASLMASGYYNY